MLMSQGFFPPAAHRRGAQGGGVFKVLQLLILILFILLTIDMIIMNYDPATRRVLREECKNGSGVRYQHFNLVEGEGKLEEEAGLRNRKTVKKEDMEDDAKKVKKKQHNQDPIRWFGLLPPPALRRSQVASFSYLFACFPRPTL